MADKQLKVFHIDDGEDWWLVATDEADALEIAKTMDIGIDDDFQELTITEVDSGKVFTIILVDGYCDDERDLYPADPVRNDDGRWEVTAKISEWIAVSKRGDCIASSMF